MRGSRRALLALTLLLAGPAWAGEAAGRSASAIAIFCALVVVTLLITRWAARLTVSRADFYVAHGHITPLQNGLAIAGDFISASTFMGITALFFSGGQDAYLYLIASVMSWPLILFLIGQRLRNLGRFTVADVCALRLDERPLRLVIGLSSLLVTLGYMIGQLVAVGALIEVLFAIPYWSAVVTVGVLMTIYVMFGGMLATTWVQIVKAILLVGGGTLLAALSLARFDFSIDGLLDAARAVHSLGDGVLAPGGLFKSTADALSLGLTLALGVAGLPHVLVRFFTVRDGAAANRSIVNATAIIMFLMLLIPVLGYGAIALLGPEAYEEGGKVLRGGNNLAVLHLAAEVGGPLFFGLIAAVAFSTILAVASGLSVSASATVAHDLYGRWLRRGVVDEGRELLVSRATVVVFSLVSVFLALLLRGQNITVLVSTAISIAAAVNLPILFASMYWRGTTTRGAVAAGLTGITVSLALTIASKPIWVAVLGHAEALYPYQYPTLIALPLSAAVLIVVSLLDGSDSAARSRASFAALRVRAHLGALEQR